MRSGVSGELHAVAEVEIRKIEGSRVLVKVIGGGEAWVSVGQRMRLDYEILVIAEGVPDISAAGEAGPIIDIESLPQGSLKALGAHEKS
jgi:hypothetical protein